MFSGNDFNLLAEQQRQVDLSWRPAQPTDRVPGQPGWLQRNPRTTKTMCLCQQTALWILFQCNWRMPWSEGTQTATADPVPGGHLSISSSSAGLPGAPRASHYYLSTAQHWTASQWKQTSLIHVANSYEQSIHWAWVRRSPSTAQCISSQSVWLFRRR